MCSTVRQGYGSLPAKMCYGESIQNALIKLGFWPGGDRDGNPFVTTDITLMPERLRTSILKCYYISKFKEANFLRC
jgi:phosphoenolpyruvate carboxylase